MNTALMINVPIKYIAKAAYSTPSTKDQYSEMASSYKNLPVIYIDKVMP